MSTLRSAVALLALTALTATAVAQPPAPPTTPPFSPYLNLLRRGTSPALNYYGLVRPEQNLRQAVQGVQSAAATNQQNIRDLANGDLAPTGVQAQFLNHGRYFLTQRGGGVGVGGGTNTGAFGGTNTGNLGGMNRPAGMGGATGGMPTPRR